MMTQSLSCPHDMTLNTLSWQDEFTELFKVTLEAPLIVKLVTKAAQAECYAHQIDINVLHSKDSYDKFYYCKPG